MFAFKKKYFLIIENTKDINLNKIKTNHKLFIIYRNSIKSENYHNLYKFRKICSIKKIKFLIANNIKLNVALKTDGIYLSSYNKSFRSLFFKDNRKIIIGSAHNTKEIFNKKIQGCNYVILSKLFKVDYAPDYRQIIADSWPNTIDDTYAREDWDWNSKYDFKKTINHILSKLALI